MLHLRLCFLDFACITIIIPFSKYTLGLFFPVMPRKIFVSNVCDLLNCSLKELTLFATMLTCVCTLSCNNALSC